MTATVSMQGVSEGEVRAGLHPQLPSRAPQLGAGLAEVKVKNLDMRPSASLAFQLAGSGATRFGGPAENGSRR